MSSKIFREASGDVVARITPSYAVRFRKNSGGAPMEFWFDGKPMITDPMLGEGCQVTYDTGQDSTQASAEGLTGFVVDNVLLKDSLDETNLSYTVEGSCPFFWLSHEKIDDVIPVGPSLWITKYANDRPNPNHWLGWGSIGFAPRNGVYESVISPKDTLYANNTFEGDIAKVRRGIGSVRTNVYLGRTGDLNCRAGIVFRGSPVKGLNASHEGVCLMMPHYRFVVSKNAWYVQERGGVIASAGLSASQISNANNLSKGIKLEVRSSVENPNVVQFFIDGVSVYQNNFPSNIDGEWFGLFAKCVNGRIDFDRREVIDMTMKFKVVSQIVANHLTIEASIKSLTSDPIKLYRANYVFFLNRSSFLNNRSTQVLKNTQWSEFDGVTQAREVSALFAGATGGDFGIKVIPLSAENDGVDAIANGYFHFLISKHQINDSFVIHANSIPFNNPQLVNESKFKMAIFNSRDS